MDTLPAGAMTMDKRELMGNLVALRLQTEILEYFAGEVDSYDAGVVTGMREMLLLVATSVGLTKEYNHLVGEAIKVRYRSSGRNSSVGQRK